MQINRTLIDLLMACLAGQCALAVNHQRPEDFWLIAKRSLRVPNFAGLFGDKGEPKVEAERECCCPPPPTMTSFDRSITK